MTIRDLQYRIQDAIDEHGVPDSAELRFSKCGEGGVLIRAEYGGGHFDVAHESCRDVNKKMREALLASQEFVEEVRKYLVCDTCGYRWGQRARRLNDKIESALQQ